MTVWKTGIKDLEWKQWDKDAINQAVDGGEINMDGETCGLRLSPGHRVS